MEMPATLRNQFRLSSLQLRRSRPEVSALEKPLSDSWRTHVQTSFGEHTTRIEDLERSLQSYAEREELMRAEQRCQATQIKALEERLTQQEKSHSQHQPQKKQTASSASCKESDAPTTALDDIDVTSRARSGASTAALDNPDSKHREPKQTESSSDDAD